MLLESEKRRFSKISRDLQYFLNREKEREIPAKNRQYYEILRKTIHLYHDIILRCKKHNMKPQGKDFERLYHLTGIALDELGGQSDPAFITLKHYNHHHYGPFLGVSDDGSAAKKIIDAALNSPKTLVLADTDPIQVGVALDAERLAAVGEVAVGPFEYRDIRLECMGKILNTTNIGTRLNLRYFKKRPLIKIPAGPLNIAINHALAQAKTAVKPFLKTPDNVPRPITIFAYFEKRRSFNNRLTILTSIRDAFNSGDFCNPECHKLALLVQVKRGNRGVKKAKEAIDLAKNAILKDVAISGVVLGTAEDKITMPGILNYFSPINASEILRYAARKNIIVSPRNLVDPDTIARSAWAGLNTARAMGFELGKYGLFPLTLPESDKVMGMIQSWFSSWSAAPAFYVDFPVVDSNTVYTEKIIKKAIKKWLQIVSNHKIPLVLIDTADKDKGRKILKTSLNDKVGILHLKEIAEIEGFAQNLGIKILWAGGIKISQAYDFGKLGVFGIYVTSAASTARAVSKAYMNDIMLTSEKEPTFEGVARVKLLLEAGFLVSRYQKFGINKKARILENQTKKFIALLAKTASGERLKLEQERLISLVLEGWAIHFKRIRT